MKRNILLSSALLIITFCITGCYRFAKSESYFGINTEGKNIVFVVDISGSMEGKNEGNISDKLRAQASNQVAGKLRSSIGGPIGGLLGDSVEKESTKLGTAKRELHPAIKGLKDGTKFTIMAFESGLDYWNKSLVAASSANKTTAGLYVDRLSSKGGTNALAALKAALKISGADMIFFLSDGQPSDGSPDKIVKEISDLNKTKKVTIHCIGLGNDKDEKFLKALAESNNGTYTEK